MTLDRLIAFHRSNEWLVLFALGGLVSLLEFAFPLAASHLAGTRRRAAQDVTWVVWTQAFAGRLADGVARFAWAAVYQLLYPWIEKAPSIPAASSIAGGILAYLLARELVIYWLHRAFHAVPALWRFHQVHHNVTEMRWMNGYRVHLLEPVAFGFPLLLVAVVLKPAPMVLWIVETAQFLVELLNHANLRFRWGPFEGILNTTRTHWFHHDKRLFRRHGQNFGAITVIWDRVFGTYHRPEGQEYLIGFEGMERFPNSFLGQLVAPFRREART